MAAQALITTGHGRSLHNDSGQIGKVLKRQTGQRVKNGRFVCEMSFEAEEKRQREKSNEEVLKI